jgi:hypothetical protein
MDALKAKVLSAFTHGLTNELAAVLCELFQISSLTPSNSTTGADSKSNAGRTPDHEIYSD